MARIQIKPITIPKIQEKIQIICRIKKNWADKWKTVSYLEPIKATESANPSVSRAELIHHYGNIKREDKTTFTDSKPKNLADYYVQIVRADSNGTYVIWTGIIQDNEYDMHGSTVTPKGDQHITAYGLEHLLDRVAITGARCKGVSETINIGWTPTFNERHTRGSTLLGNRSTDINTDEVYEFSSEGEEWSHLDILNYILKYHQPGGITFTLGGQYEILDSIKTVQRMEGLTVRQAMNKLIDRRRGLGWCIRTIGSSNVSIHIFSVFEKPISVGDVVIPPNQEQATMTFDNAIDIEQALIRLITSTKYDKIIVRGERIKTCFTIEYASDTLENGWTDALEQEYKVPFLDEDAKVNDSARGADKFERVYTTFRIPSDWDWTIDGKIVSPTIKKDGSLDIVNSTPIWNFNRILERELPLLKGYDYAEDTPENQNPSNSEPEYRRPFAAVKVDVEDSDSGTLYFFVDKLADAEIGSNIQVRMLDREMGIELQGSPRHEMALNSWDGANPSANNPDVDYETLIATVCAKTDTYLAVEVDVSENVASESARTLIINVEDAELSYILKGTVIDIIDGELVRYEGDGIIRDDSARLRTIAALARAWYAQKRTAITLTLKNIIGFSPVGTFIVSASSSWHQEPVGTVVSQRMWDFRSKTSQVETGFFEMDMVSMSQMESPDIPDIKAASKIITDNIKDIKDIRRYAGGLPARFCS